MGLIRPSAPERTHTWVLRRMSAFENSTIAPTIAEVGCNDRAVTALLTANRTTRLPSLG